MSPREALLDKLRDRTLKKAKVLPALRKLGAPTNDRECSILVAALGRHSFWENAFSVAQHFLSGERCEDEAAIYRSSIVASSRAARWAEGLSLLQQAGDRQLTLDGAMFGAATTGCSRSSRWQEAFGVLDWHGRATGSTSTLCHGRTMNSDAEGGKLRAKVFAAALLSLERGHFWNLALVALDDEVRRGGFADSVVIGTLVSTCSKGQSWQHALHYLFQEESSLTSLGLSAWTSTIASCSSSTAWEQAIRLLADLKRRSIDAEVRTVGAAMAACEKSSSWEQAIGLLAEYPNNDSLISLATATSACSRATRWLEALVLHERTKSLGLQPDAGQIRAVASSLARSRKWEESAALLSSGAFQADQDHSAVIGAYAAGHRWQAALDYLLVQVATTHQRHRQQQLQEQQRQSRQRRRPLDGEHRDTEGESPSRQSVRKRRTADVDPSCLVLPLSAFNATISACGAARRWREALQLLPELRSCHLEANAVTAAALLQALSAGERGLLALQLLNDFQRARVEVDAVGLGAAVAACEKEDLWQEALSLLREVWAMKPDETTVSAATGAALGTCERASEWTSSLELLDITRAVTGQLPDDAALSSVIRSTSRADRWEMALHLVKTFEQAGDALGLKRGSMLHLVVASAGSHHALPRLALLAAPSGRPTSSSALEGPEELQVDLRLLTPGARHVYACSRASLKSSSSRLVFEDGPSRPRLALEASTALPTSNAGGSLCFCFDRSFPQ